jgi:hypothetical protein
VQNVIRFTRHAMHGIALHGIASHGIASHGIFVGILVGCGRLPSAAVISIVGCGESPVTVVSGDSQVRVGSD